MYNLATLAIIHKLITYFCILVRPRQKLKMFGFIKHTCCTTEEKSHYKNRYFFLRLWSMFLSLPIRKWWCNISITCFLVLLKLSRVQFSSVAQSCLTLCDPMDCSIWNKANFPSHQPALLIGFQPASSQTPHTYLSVKIWGLMHFLT